MNLLAWNIRGLANKPSLRRLKKLVKANNIGVLAILEPKLGHAHLNEIMFKLNYTGAVANQEGNIWVLWKSEMKCSIIFNCPQYVAVNVFINNIEVNIFLYMLVVIVMLELSCGIT